VIGAGIFLTLMFIMIAVVFSEHFHPESDFPHNKVEVLFFCESSINRERKSFLVY